MKALYADMARLGADTGPLVKALSAAGRLAVEPIAAATRSALPHVTGALAGDVRTSASRTGAAVRYGRAKLNYAGWIEFGGTRHRPHESSRPFNPRGWYLMPAARTLADTAARMYSEATAKEFDSYPWTNAGSDGGSVHD
jgi:hypothetical protein